MENTTQLFLAVRFNCNKCHDHPFERWTQDQYYHLAAYFAQVGRKDDPASRRPEDRRHRRRRRPSRWSKIIYDTTARRSQARAAPGKSAAPTFPYQHADLPPADGRRAASSWPSGSPSKDNQYFAKSYVNRLWGYLLGVGIIEPIDDIRAGNPPTNPELLDRLTNEFVDSGFDVQHMMQHDLQVADVSALDRRPTSGTRTTTSTTRTPSPAGCRPRCCTTRSTRATGAIEPAARRAGRHPRGAAARRRRRAARAASSSCSASPPARAPASANAPAA